MGNDIVTAKYGL